MTFSLEDLVQDLEKEGVLRNPRIREALFNIDRKDFVPKEMAAEAYINAPLPIGEGQTISQPLTVVFMLELLQPKSGEKVLDIGSGSGWTTALLAYLVSRAGKVFAIERLCELMEWGKENVAKYNFIEKGIVEMKCADAIKGWPEKAPFDAIHAAAAAEAVPSAWKEQLAIGGRLVVPVRSSIVQIIRKSPKEFLYYEHPGFSFVPLISED